MPHNGNMERFPGQLASRLMGCANVLEIGIVYNRGAALWYITFRMARDSLVTNGDTAKIKKYTIRYADD